MIKKLFLLFHTIRYLKPIQFYWRLHLKTIQFFPFLGDINQPVAVSQVKLVSCIDKHTSWENGRFCFLNEVNVAGFPVDWNNQQFSKLWLYNLHYFDYINQAEMDSQLALDLINDWIQHNSVGIGNGWEPYTLSLRIVNWIKFLSRSGFDGELLVSVQESLFLQSHYLFKHLEYHLLGNHLFKNGVALIFTGSFFEGKEAQSWLKKGCEIITQQTKEQILNDGGHFERSPMYHVLILEDILDCLNLDKTTPCFSSSEATFMKRKAMGMLGFLANIVHQDNDIPFFNDSALHIAPSPEAVFKYAEDLDLQFSKNNDAIGVIEKPDFGLIILQNQLSKLILDVGLIGPQYLPGHAHCDTLSYELSLAGKRCIVNSGTYQYAGDERNLFRATSAHNTVQIDGMEQHEIWSTFRVARRAYPFDISIKKQSEGAVECSASISGFKQLPGNPTHKRVVRYQKNQIQITDLIGGEGRHLAESFIHLHPGVKIVKSSEDVLECMLGGSAFSIKTMEGVMFDIEKGWFSSEFGLKTENTVLVLRKQAMSPFSFGYTIFL